MTYIVPCGDPKNDSDDWFIRDDGKQYNDDTFLTEAEVAGLTKSVLRIEGETSDEHEARVGRAIRAATADRKRAQLRKRRHAREECFGCYFRTNCLDLALKNGERHGTWGGYFEEDLKRLRGSIDRRNRSRELRLCSTTEE